MTVTTNIPAMTPTVVHDYLREVGRAWKGQGVAVELGAWLGATAVPLLQGLVEAGYDHPFYAFDRWRADEQQVEKARVQGKELIAGQDLHPLFLENAHRAYDQVVLVQGMMPGTFHRFPKKESVEVMLFDAPKRDHVFLPAVRRFERHWIPGVTILGFLDFYFYRSRTGRNRRRLMGPVHLVKENPGCFSQLAEWPGECTCVFFRYERKIKHLRHE